MILLYLARLILVDAELRLSRVVYLAVLWQARRVNDWSCAVRRRSETVRDMIAGNDKEASHG